MNSIYSCKAYAHLLWCKIWRRLLYDGGEEPERLERGETPPSTWDKWHHFWHLRPARVANCLYVGSAADAADCATLESLEIALVVNCTEDIPNFYAGDDGSPEYIRIAVEDERDAHMAWNLDAIERVQRVREQGKNVLIHCFMGASRSVAVACAVLVLYENLAPDEAYAQISLQREAARMNRNFMDDLLILRGGILCPVEYQALRD